MGSAVGGAGFVAVGCQNGPGDTGSSAKTAVSDGPDVEAGALGDSFPASFQTLAVGEECIVWSFGNQASVPHPHCARVVQTCASPQASRVLHT